jgi:hypothetical protein
MEEVKRAKQTDDELGRHNLSVSVGQGRKKQRAMLKA